MTRKEILRAALREQARVRALEQKENARPFSLEAFCGRHAEQLSFARDPSHRTHVMCARQSGKSQGDDGILLDTGLLRPNSTNLILGLNSVAIRSNNWEPIWTRLWDNWTGLDSKWHNHTRMLTTFPNRARVFFGGSDDARHIKNLLGGRIEDGVVIIDECFPVGTLVDGRPIETIRVGDIVTAVDHVTGRLVRRRVVRVFSKISEYLVRVSFCGGSFACTENHPVFIKGRGYVNANDTREGDLLCVRRASEESINVLGGMRGREDGALSRRVGISALLQAGSGGPINQDMYRGRWSEPLLSADAGREEDAVLEWSRVESVSRVEPGSSGGTTVYNLEVEGAHTYFANGVLVHNCQDQGAVLDELLDSILPPMMGMGARLILSGVIPEVPAGRFWRESGWVERGGVYVQEKNGWSTHNWGRLANVHTPDARQVLDRYLTDTGLTEDDPQIQRDWFGRPAFDPAATAYRYLPSRNGYTPVIPDWLANVYGAQVDEKGRQIVYAHPMQIDKDDGVRFGMLASTPLPGNRTFSFAIDPGSDSDRCAIEGWAWGPSSREVQHVFEWSTPRGQKLSTGQIFVVAGVVQRVFGQLGGIISWRYDAGSSQNTIDNLLNDYKIPLVLAAKKADLKGQVDRNNDLLTQGRAKAMIGSALEQDYQRARWDKGALANGGRRWAGAWHPDPSEAARYALQDYFDAYREPPPKSIFDNEILKRLMTPQNPDRPNYE